MKRLWMFLFCTLFVSLTHTAYAQNATPQLTVTGVDTSNLPSVQLTLAISDESGQLLEFNTGERVSVKHNGERVTQASVVGSEPAGTFTIILLDLSSGAADQIDTIQSSIQSFASSAYMREQIDHIAIFQVNDANSVELLPTTFFYNDVTNLFATGLQPFDGATALYDSMGDLLSRIEQLKPSPELATSIVLMSDGTDAVSSQFVADEVAPLASSKGIALHTAVIDTGLSDFSRDIGRDYMQALAADTGGISAGFTDAASLNDIWTRIISRGSNTLIRYLIDDLQPGVFDVEISFPNQAQLPLARTQVTVPASIPRVSIDTPEVAYTLSLPLVEETNAPEALEVRLPVSVLWLDGTERSIARAQVWLNGAPVFDIAPEEFELIQTQLELRYGANQVQVVVIDDTNQQASSTPLLLTVNEGNRDVPSDIGRSGGLGIPRNILWFIGICLLILALLAALRMVWPRLQAMRPPEGDAPRRNVRADNAPRARMQQPDVDMTPAPSARPTPAPVRDHNRPPAPPPPSSAPPPPAPAPPVAPAGSSQHTVPSPTHPSIEVLESETQVAILHPIHRSEYLIGRSATVDLPLKEDPTVSRIHATIVQDGDVYRIYDEQSTSGTYVNDREVPEYGLQLSDGDEIHLGAVHLRFRQP